MKLTAKRERRARRELTQVQRVTLISTVVAIALILIGMLTGDAAILGNLVIIAVLVFVSSIFILKYIHMAWVKSAEEQFPNFVRDLADSIRSGMSFSEAVSITSKSNYGKLTDEIVKMSNRLTWGTPFTRVLDIFGKKVKDSRLITEALNVIKESQESGGNVAATLDAIARDMMLFKEVEADRESLTRQHVYIMYGIYLMFLGIAIMIIFIMVPMVKVQPEATPGTFGFAASNPCAELKTFPCDYFSSLGVLFNMPDGITLYYTALFFTIVLVQGIFTGLIAGQLGEGSVLAGGKHSLIMVVIALGVFLFLTKAGMIPI